jgi:hypothetical protein
MTQTVFAIKLTNGEDVITRVLEETDSTFIVDHPAYLVIQQTEDGRSGVSIAPLAPTSPSGKVTIFKSGVTATWEVDDKLSSEYEKVFFPGKIQLVNTPGKLIV